MTIDRENLTLIIAIAGAVFGLLGAVLGVINTWRAFDRDRVRLRVEVVWLVSATDEEAMGIVVTNLSFIPVSVSNVGFVLRRSRRQLVVLNRLTNGEQLPQRMEPRTQITAVVTSPTYNHPDFRDVVTAYAKTECGRRFIGTSPALKSHLRDLRSARPDKQRDASDGA